MQYVIYKSIVLKHIHTYIHPCILQARLSYYLTARLARLYDYGTLGHLYTCCLRTPASGKDKLHPPYPHPIHFNHARLQQGARAAW
jgi:hypothetical protein